MHSVKTKKSLTFIQIGVNKHATKYKTLQTCRGYLKS